MPLSNHDEHSAATKEQVLEEGRKHLNMPGRDALLLSMLGVVLSPAAHAYLKRTEPGQGLKHYLAQFPNEFKIDGAKGSDSVKYLKAQPLSPDPTAYSYIPTPNPWTTPCDQARGIMSQSTNVIHGGMHGCVDMGLNTLSWPGSFGNNWTGADSMLVQKSVAQLWTTDNAMISESFMSAVPGNSACFNTVEDSSTIGTCSVAPPELADEGTGRSMRAVVGTGAWSNRESSKTVGTFSTSAPMFPQPATADFEATERRMRVEGTAHFMRVFPNARGCFDNVERSNTIGAFSLPAPAFPQPAVADIEGELRMQDIL